LLYIRERLITKYYITLLYPLVDALHIYPSTVVFKKCVFIADFFLVKYCKLQTTIKTV